MSDTSVVAPGTRSIELDVEIGVPAEVVWRALTDPTELARWFPPIAGGSSEVGGKLLLSWGAPVEWRTTVTKLDPARHVQWADDPNSPMVVDWHIDGRGGRSVVRLVHSGWSTGAEWDDQFDGTEAGWRYFLFNLRHYLERHHGTARVMVSARRPSPLPRPLFWDRLMGPKGFGMSSTDRSAALRPGGRVTIHLSGEAQPFDVVHVAPPNHLWGILPELNHALLLVEAEPGREGYHVGFWLSTYGLNQARVTALQGALSATAEEVTRE